MGLKERFRQLVTAHSAESGKISFLINDMTIEEQLCQMRCSYCLTEEYNLLMDVPDARVRLTTDMRQDWHEVLRLFNEHVDCPVMRLSGGEFFWLKGSTEFVQECSTLYETVQVVTNGVFLVPERMAALAALGNFQFNLSLDGHTPEMNRHRFPPRQAKLFSVVMKHLEDAVNIGIPVEILCVLTDANISGQLAFCEFLHEHYDGRVMLYFFPIRGDSARDFLPPPGGYLDEVLDRYQEFSGILPPRAYVENVAEQLRRGSRSIPCYVTATMAQLFGQGDVSACPYAWIKPMGNVTETHDILPQRFANHQHYELFMQERPRFSFCKGCATPADLINLYFLDRISDEEIDRCPLFSGPRARARVRELKSLYQPILTADRRRTGSKNADAE